MISLSPRQSAFVEGCFSGLSSAEAARKAGYGAAYSAKGAKLLQHPGIAAALKEGQRQVRARTLYTVEVAMDELDKAMTFAETHKSAMALSRLIEIRCKLNHLLVDHLEITQMVDIGSALLEAKQRVNGVTQIASTSVSVPEQPSHVAHDMSRDTLFD
jgi:phage terminase small subunit